MRPLLLLIVLAVLVLGAAGVLLLGAFPPQPATQPVAHTLPNDRFGAH